MTGKRAYLPLIVFLFGYGTAAPNTAMAADQEGLAEAGTAFHYGRMASVASGADGARTDLQEAINCLVGPRDRSYQATAGDPCKGRGKGALSDITDASVRQQLRFAVGEALRGLAQPDLTSVQMNARAALDYLTSAGIADSLDTAPSVPADGVKPSSAVVALGPGQVEASQLDGAAVKDRDGTIIGTIADLVIAAEPHAIRLVGLRTAGTDGGEVAIQWSDLDLTPEPAKASYRSALTREAVAAAPPFADQLHAPSSVDIEHDLIGRGVVAAAGRNIGSVANLVIELKTGTIDYVLVAGNQKPAARDTRPLAIRWNAIADLKAERSIVLTLDAAQLAAVPRFAGP